MNTKIKISQLRITGVDGHPRTLTLQEDGGVEWEYVDGETLDTWTHYLGAEDARALYEMLGQLLGQAPADTPTREEHSEETSFIDRSGDAYVVENKSNIVFVTRQTHRRETEIGMWKEDAARLGRMLIAAGSK